MALDPHTPLSWPELAKLGRTQPDDSDPRVSHALPGTGVPMRVEV